MAVRNKKRSLSGFINTFGKVTEEKKDVLPKTEAVLQSESQIYSFAAKESLPIYSNVTNLQIEVAPVQNEIPISEFIKRLQMSGVKFYLSPRYFETAGRALSQIEHEKLQANAGRVLCQLQQAALENKIFRFFPDLRGRFKFEVFEREMILLDSDEPNALYKAVRQTVFIWFHDYFLDGAMA